MREVDVAGSVEIRAADLTGVETFCYQYISGETILIHQAQAVDQVRVFMGRPEMPVTFLSMDRSLNAPDPLRVAVFTDEYGSRIAVDVDTLQVVEADLFPHVWSTPPLQSLPVSELRSRALDLVSSNTPNFTNIQSRLTYREGTKGEDTFGGVYFFSWDDMTYEGWQAMPPMARVGLLQDGRLITYVNSLFLAR